MDFLEPIILAIGVFIVIKGTIRYWKDYQIKKEIDEEIKESVNETLLMRSGDMPKEVDIQKYYKMYLKKEEKRNMQEWDTKEPMSYEDFRERALTPSKVVGNGLFRSVGGYEFLVSITSDAVMSFGGQTTFLRYNNYDDEE